MDNEDMREEDEKSLLKTMAKQGISKIIKKMPLKVKLIIIGVIAGIIIFLIMFIVLASAVSMLFFFNGNGSGNGNGDSNLSYIDYNAEDNYWWPIGSANVETKNGKEFATGIPSSTRVTSYYSPSRTMYDDEGNEYTEAHKGIDIGGSTGYDYIISIAKGTVYGVGNDCDNSGYYKNPCGGGWGNYVMIEHANSVYTIYAHLLPGSITVEKGDNVEQGQIIGKMGNSGSSTGNHLHFQIEVGGRSSTYAVDPLNYVSEDKTRPVTKNSGYNGGNQLLTMLQSWEGTGPTEDNYYKVYDDGTGTLTVGHGVTLKYNVERFKKRGIDTSTLSQGSKVEKSLVDDIESEIVKEKRSDVVNLININNIDLEEYQIDALTIRVYNTGNIDGFPSKYNQYGNTESLFENYMNEPVKGGGVYMSGLDRRRQAEWNLFHNGIYTLNM